ncbi:MAG: hypothetical protein V4562_07755, partial [Pseudomonadota bacterium]
MKLRRFFLLASCLLGCASAQAFEADVHFGLTKWLALKAGFAEAQAEAIAAGNQRSDSGVMDSVQLVLEYACLESHADAARVAQGYHFASPAKLPAPPAQRAVVAGDATARKPAEEVLAAAAQGKAGFLLLKLGQALHLLQDSWAYQGVPDTPVFAGTGIQCNSALAWAAPAARGGWNSHKANLAREWPADIAAMAEASYRVLTAYPTAGVPRNAAADWAVLRPSLDGFVRASTKAEKARWFQRQGITDTTFLQGISLPDGPNFASGEWAGRRFPPLKTAASPQYNVAADTKAFFDSFFPLWLGPAKGLERLRAVVDVQQQPDLLARLRLWRLRDHGAVAELAHAAAPFTPAQLRTLERLDGKPHATVQLEGSALAGAFYPLLQQGPGVSPLLPYVLHTLPPSDTGKARAIAVVKLRHLPYDELGLVAEKQQGGWRLVRLIA